MFWTIVGALLFTAVVIVLAKEAPGLLFGLGIIGGLIWLIF